MERGKAYIYENSIVIYGAGRGKRTKLRKEVIYTGREGAWHVFTTAKGTELRLHDTDIKKFIKEA